MNWFLDTEFLESGPAVPIQLISIGLVSEEGQEYYAENVEFNPVFATPWLKENVVPYLTGERKTREQIRNDILRIMPPNTEPKVWAYYGAYDWVVFCQIFGKMIDLPRGYPFYARELKMAGDYRRFLKDMWPKQVGQKHNALEDAKWCKIVWETMHKHNPAP